VARRRPLAALRQRRQPGPRERDGLPRADRAGVERSLRDPLALDLERPREGEPRQVTERVPVGDPVRPDPHGREDGLELHQARRRRAVRQHEPIGDEVAVVQRLAEVAAVGEIALRAADAVVDPLPHEAAGAARPPLEQRLVLGQPAGPVAHRVRVLAQDERLGTAGGVELRVLERRLLVAAERVDLLVRGVHAAVDVAERRGEVVLVVQRPRRVAAPRPVRHRGEVGADAALVAQRPHDHARVVLVALDGAGDAIEVRIPPARVVTRVAAPADLLEAVRLEVALGDHVEPELVAELEEARVRRIVTRPHRVDVVRLHQLGVAAHDRLCHRTPAIRVPLVPVDPTQQHAAAVDAQLAVLGRDRAEADPQRDRLACGAQLAVVEPRQLGAPRLDRPGGDGLARRAVDAEPRHDHARRDVAVDPQRAVGLGVDEHIAGAAGRAREQLDAPEQAGQPPHVLVLEVGARRPLRDVHLELVLVPQQRADLELVDEPAPVGVAQLGAVQPCPQVRVRPAEAQHGRPLRPPRGQREAAPVLARRVRVGHVRRVDGERIGDVRVRGRAVPVQLPVRRDGQLAPLPAARAEPPRAVQRQRGRARARPRARRQRAAAYAESSACRRSCAASSISLCRHSAAR
jgi:hypothetical protein